MYLGSGVLDYCKGSSPAGRRGFWTGRRTSWVVVDISDSWNRWCNRCPPSFPRLKQHEQNTSAVGTVGATRPNNPFPPPPQYPVTPHHKRYDVSYRNSCIFHESASHSKHSDLPTAPDDLFLTRVRTYFFVQRVGLIYEICSLNTKHNVLTTRNRITLMT